MKILFASQNPHKLKEIRNILQGFSIISLNDLHDNDEVVEDGKTFFENAFKKAHHFHQKYHIPVFSDDSGLVVKALNGDPGVHSARFSGQDVNYKRNNEFLLDKMKHEIDREAYFVTVICFIDELGQTHYFEGQWKGIIAKEEKGEKGFGYDPLFFISSLGKTAAELTLSEKNEISHRALALKQFHQYLIDHFHKLL
ncbi:MAG: RdgB/HAM1 family non-canonical purine NTP pyrophosphatase [Bacilli bacterium]